MRNATAASAATTPFRLKPNRSTANLNETINFVDIYTGGSILKNILYLLLGFFLSIAFVLNVRAEGCISESGTYKDKCIITHYYLYTNHPKTEYLSVVVNGWSNCLPTTVQAGSNNSVVLPAKQYYLNSYAWTGTSWQLVQQRLWSILDRDSEQSISILQQYGINEHPSTIYPSGIPNCGEEPNNCHSKVGQKFYNLKLYEPGDPPATEDTCYQDCKATAKSLWNDCLGGACVISMEYTYTGDECGGGEPIEVDVKATPPERCTDEINEKIAYCGGTLKVLSFNFETCTGDCTPDACAGKWQELVGRCGGIMAVSTWNAATCSGSCVNDPLPDPEVPQTETPPKDVTTVTTTNSDGTKETTQTVSYTIDGTTHTTTTTTYYDAGGDVVSSSVTSSSSPSSKEGASETFSPIQAGGGFGEGYGQGSGEEYDIPLRFNAFLDTVQSSPLFGFSNDFFNSLPAGGSSTYQIDAGQYGSHSIDLSDTLANGLAVLKTLLLICFGFLSIRAVIMKR